MDPVWRDLSSPRRSGPTAADDGLAGYFDISLDLICVRDRNLRINRVNTTWTEVLGYSVDELEGMEMLSLVHPEDVAATREQMARVDGEGESRVVGFINRYRHREGGYRSLEWRAKRVGDRVYGAARDVTERLIMEKEIEAARRAAEASNQAKSDFLANISHEIRTPLNGVIGVAAALGQTPLTPAQREMVRLIESSGETLERLVSDLLDISKIEAGSIELETRIFDLDDLDAAIETNRLRAEEKGLVFVVERDAATQGRFVGDLTRIRQVLDNLLSNAVKFTHQGQVRVRVALAPSPEARLTLEVEDSGIGFPPEFAANLFKRFSQADTTITRRFGGTGLGLSICHALVRMMGGHIDARSRPGEGSLFRAVIPLRPAGVEDLAEAPPPANPRARTLGDGQRPLRILLAEDHPINQRVVQLILEPYGVDLTTVDDGAKAAAAFAEGNFDLVLMDMQMPEMDGLTAVRRIRAHEAGRARTPIAMLSANAMARHQQEALEVGADVHIAKPVTALTLIAGIEQALATTAG